MSLADRLRALRDRIEQVCASVDRDPQGVTLVAVSKTFSVDAIREAYDAGLRHFGESRLQEAEPKIAALPDDIVWHFVGKLQSNKARRVASQFSVVHTLESPSQIREIAKAEATIDGLIEINIADEPQKSGIRLAALDEFVQECLHCDRVRLRGLMTIGPQVRNAEDMRPYFRKLRERLSQVPKGTWLSMGMSSDFDVAIQEGATHIRVGTALFGDR